MKNLFKLPGIMLLGFVVLALAACTPKQSEAPQEAPQAQTQNAEGVTATQTASLSADFQINSDNGKLLKSWDETNHEGYGSTLSFEYDNQNRIVKYYSSGSVGDSTTTITYSGDDLVKTVNVYHDGWEDETTVTESSYVRDRNIITVTSESKSNTGAYHLSNNRITLNDDGYIIKQEGTHSSGETIVSSYQYRNGNLINMRYVDELFGYNFDTEYEYDNRRSPFFHNKTPKWYLVLSFEYIGLINNIIAKTITDSSESEEIYEYEYDGDGFSTVRSRQGWYIYFTYQDTTEKPLAVAKMYYATTNLRLRSEPDTSRDNRIAGVSEGDSVELLETGITATIDSITAPWFRVKTRDGTIGWLFSGYLREE